MATALITGANKGLGHEVARRPLDAGHDVWLGARDATRGQSAADELGARFVALDVTSEDTVQQEDIARVAAQVLTEDGHEMFRTGRASVVTDDVLNVTGVKPRTFRGWCERHADEFGVARARAAAGA